MPRSRSKANNPLLQQALPRQLSALLDMFASMQTIYEVMRKRGQRTTYQNMRQAVEEASGRRFLPSHVAQLQHLLPEAVALEWVCLPVVAHSSRTEPHLLITLDLASAAGAAAECGAAPSAAAGYGELQAARHLLHCRLAAHLLDSYCAMLEGRAAALRQAGDEAEAEQLEAAAEAAAAKPPVSQFVPPYPEGSADVQQSRLPPRPAAASPASRSLLSGPTAAAQLQAVQLTPVTTGRGPPPSTGRHGRPPVYPNTVDRHVKQRRLSFSQTAAGGAAVPSATKAAGAAASQASPSPSALAAAAGRGLTGGRTSAACTPLEKLDSELTGRQQQQPEHQLLDEPRGIEVHPKQAALAASLCEEDLQFNGSLLSEQDACLLASMPEQLRRMSTDGIISLDTLRMLDIAEQQHKRLSGPEAQKRRVSNAALGQLPRTFTRVQRIFGVQGPNALKLHDVVLRIKQGGLETTPEAQVEQQLRALAQHAPDYLSVKPFGRCGTPALWINRAVNGNAVMQRLKQVASARLQQPGVLA